MADSLQTMLDYRELTASYRSAGTMQGTPMTDLFFTNVKRTSGDELVIPIHSRNNQPMPGNSRGAAPRRQAGPGMTKKQFNLFASFNEYDISFNALRFLMSDDPNIRMLGEETVQAMVDEGGERQRLFREVVLSQIMTQGVVYLDDDGQVLVPTVDATTGVVTAPSGAVVAADFGVPDTRRGRCDQDTGGGTDYVFSGAWDTETTNWFEELERCRDISLKAGAPVPDTVLIHRLQKSAMIESDVFKEWAVYNNLRNEQVMTAATFENVRGWTFKFVEGYWTDSSGTQRPILPVRNAIIYPGGNDSWKDCREGLQPVPKTVGVVPDFNAAKANITWEQGLFAYAHVALSPVLSAQLFMGDNFGIGIRDGSALWMPTVFAS